jgi:hypothetical protein
VWVLAAGVIIVAATGVAAQVGSAGGVTIFDATNCAGSGNAAKVTPPFSILVTGLPPLSRTTQLYVTDKDAKPEITYGPFTIQNVTAQGIACVNVLNAPAGSWKVDVVEPGSGFTDSKVFTVEGPAPATTTTTPRVITTTTTAASTTTTAAPSTTGPAQSTTTTAAGSTTSAAPVQPTTLPPTAPPTATAAPATTLAPPDDLPWDFDPATPVVPGSLAPPVLPASGARSSVPIAAAAAAFALGLVAVAVTRRRAGASS